MTRLIAVLATARIRRRPLQATRLDQSQAPTACGLVMSLIAIIVNSSSIIDPGEVTAD
jgi:hypothetical protein